jgi:queuosine precursor transporter
MLNNPFNSGKTPITPNIKFYLPLAAGIIFLLLLANLTVQKIVSIGFFILTVGDFIYPLTYVLDGTITEVYGYALSRRIIWLTLIINISFALLITIAIKVPHAEIWKNQEAFALIFGQAARICVASFVAFVSGEFINSYVIAKLKIKTAGKYLWFRTISAVALSQAIDTLIFTFIAFFGVIPIGDIMTMIISVYIFKIIYNSLATPIIYFLSRYLKRKEKIDVYDYHTNFNPFKINS